MYGGGGAGPSSPTVVPHPALLHQSQIHLQQHAQQLTVAPTETESVPVPRTPTGKLKAPRAVAPPAQDPSIVSENFRRAVTNPGPDGNVAFHAAIDLVALRRQVAQGAFVGLGTALHDPTIEIDLASEEDGWKGVTKIVRLLIKQHSGLAFTYHDTRLNGKRYFKSSRYHCSQRSTKSKPPGSAGGQRYACRGILTIDLATSRDEAQIHFTHRDHDYLTRHPEDDGTTPSAAEATLPSPHAATSDGSVEDRDAASATFEDWLVNASAAGSHPDGGYTEAMTSSTSVSVPTPFSPLRKHPPPLEPIPRLIPTSPRSSSKRARVEREPVLPPLEPIPRESLPSLQPLQSPMQQSPISPRFPQQSNFHYGAPISYPPPNLALHHSVGRGGMVSGLTSPHLAQQQQQSSHPLYGGSAASSPRSASAMPMISYPPVQLSVSADDLDRSARTYHEAYNYVRDEQQRRAIVAASFPGADVNIGADPVAVDLAMAARPIRSLLDRGRQHQQHRAG